MNDSYHGDEDEIEHEINENRRLREEYEEDDLDDPLEI